ncbi:hypothetical protein LTR95_004919 [Oleoguttula sp. CCFEE 5521]
MHESKSSAPRDVCGARRIAILAEHKVNASQWTTQGYPPSIGDTMQSNIVTMHAIASTSSSPDKSSVPLIDDRHKESLRLRGGDETSSRDEEPSTFKQVLKIGRLAQRGFKTPSSESTASHYQDLLTEALDHTHPWLKIADEEITALERKLRSSAPRDVSDERHRGITEKGPLKLGTSLTALGWKVMKRDKSDKTRLEVLREVRAWVREWLRWGEAELEALDKDRKQHEHKHRRRHRRTDDDTMPHDRPSTTDKVDSKPHPFTTPGYSATGVGKHHAPATNGVQSDYRSSRRYRPTTPAQQPSSHPQYAAPPMHPQPYATIAPSATPLQQAPPQSGYVPPTSNMPISQMQPQGRATPGAYQQPMHTQPNAASFMHPSQTSSRQVPIPVGTSREQSATGSRWHSRQGQRHSKPLSQTAQAPAPPVEAPGIQPQYIPGSSGGHSGYLHPQRSTAGSVRLPVQDHAWAQPDFATGQPDYVPAALSRPRSQASGHYPANGTRSDYASPGQQSVHTSNEEMPSNMPPTSHQMSVPGPRTPAAAFSHGTAPPVDLHAPPDVYPPGMPPIMAHGNSRGAPASARSQRSAQQARSQASSASKVSDWMASVTNEAPDKQVPAVTSPATSRSAASTRTPTARQDYAQMPHVSQVPLADPQMYQDPQVAPSSTSHYSTDRFAAEMPTAQQDYVQEPGPGYRPETTAASSADGPRRTDRASRSEEHGARTGGTRSATTARPRMQAYIPEALSHHSGLAPSVHQPQPLSSQHGQRAPSQHSRYTPSHHSSTQTAYRTQPNVPIITEEPGERVAAPAEEPAEIEVSSAHFRGYEKLPPKPRLCRHQDADWDPEEQGSCTSEADSCQLTPSRSGIDWEHKCVICDAELREAARLEEEAREKAGG